MSHKLIASDRKSNSIHRCACMHVRKRPIQSVSVSDNVLNIARQITECLPLVNCLLWLPASIYRLFLLQLFKSAIHTHWWIKIKEDTFYQKYCDEWNLNRHLNGYVSSIKNKIVVDILSSLLNNYHVHLNINLVRLHLLSICEMLINMDSLCICIYIYILWRLTINKEVKLSFCWRKLIEAAKTSEICKHRWFSFYAMNIHLLSGLI